MTKVLVWGAFIFIVGVTIHFHDIYSKKCKEAGGLPTLTISDMVCLHPSSVIELN